MPEFDRKVIDALREPLEAKKISVSRSGGRAVFPADFTLIAAMNRCPCGNLGSDKMCTCSNKRKQDYLKRISGPVADRIDLWTSVNRIDLHKENKVKSITSEQVKEMVISAQQIQKQRFKNCLRPLNGRVSERDFLTCADITDEATLVANKALDSLKLSMRSYYKLLRTARTIADLESNEKVLSDHVLEALQFRERPV